MPITLIRTKLHRPPTASDHMHREHLLKRLNARLHRPLTLVSAPAGYGKSVLVAQWAEQLDSTIAWLSLDAGDSDLSFVAHFRKQYHEKRNNKYVAATLCRYGFVLAFVVGSQRKDPKGRE